MFALSISILFLVVQIISCDPISFTECDTDTNIGKLNLLVIPGDPIEVSKSHPVNLSIGGNIFKPVNDDVDLTLDIKKQVDIFGIKKWISIPCVDGYGSCTQKLADYLSRYNSTFVCKLLTQMGKPCSLPLAPGSYAASNYIIQVNLSKIPSAILSLADGLVKVHIEVSNSQTLYCVDVTANIKLESNYNEGAIDNVDSEQRADDKLA